MLVYVMSLKSLEYLVGYLVHAVKVKYIPRFVISLAGSSMGFAPQLPMWHIVITSGLAGNFLFLSNFLLF